MSILKIIPVAFVVCLTSINSFATVKLAVIFQSNMVLQRDKEVFIWGFADKGEQIALDFNGKNYGAITTNDGKWKVNLPPQSAGGPFKIIVTGKNNSITLENILFGDVWICGGQSNMQYTLDQIGYTPFDTASIRKSNIRLFTVSIDMDYVPKNDLAGGTWKVANAQTIKNFSATAYFFGKHLHDSINVPIGLISDNLGATSVETWMSGEALSKYPQFNNYYKTYLQPAKSFKEITAAFEKSKPDWEKNFYLKGQGIEQKWHLPETDVSGWKTIEIPNWWEDKGLNDFDGAVWFRKTFDLPKNFNGQTFSLALHQIDDYDIVWVNGQKVGEGYGNLNWRNYQVPASMLKPEGNVVVVRVFDVGGKGGIYTNPIWWNPMLTGQWLFKPDYKIDASKFPKAQVVNVSPFSTPAILYNANIDPITSLAVKGFIWYQGESNASRAFEYRQLFPEMINDWRKQFKQGDLPFLFVQLANYMEEPTTPGESDWAELRDAQAAALKLPNTGMAVAIDIGEANDIHPKNKMDVGKRLALAALEVAYNSKTKRAGPTYKSMKIEGDRIVIQFATSGKLVTKDKYGYVRGFAIAGNDNKFYWAKAQIRDRSIIVYSDKVMKPIAVRYAWADNPGSLDLYDSGGLPAAPFRTDNLPLKTKGKVYSDNPWEF